MERRDPRRRLAGAAGSVNGLLRTPTPIYLSVDDLTVEERRLKAAGVKYEGPVTQPYGMKEVSFEDPDGYAWAIGQKVG
ncbi:MAG TPA: VOC family protein [Vicinamibacteria bacterium]|nr:VOC family protein [Vicinamibacteria bacterium]